MLMTAAIAAAVLGIMSVSFLAWVTNEYRLNRRAHAWSQSQQLCEAGVELGLSELNYAYRYDPSPSASFRPADGWAPIESSTGAQKTVNNFTDSTGKVLGNFTIAVKQIKSLYPMLECTGTATGVSNTNGITRMVRVVVQRQGFFRYAWVAKDWIYIKLSSGVIDSFNSTKSTESTNGQYVPAKATPRANVGTPATTVNAITLDKSDLYGIGSTGVGGHVLMLPVASIGATFTVAQRSGTELTAEAKGWVTHDFVMEFPDVVLPPELSVATNLGTFTGGTISSGDWRVNTLNNTSGNVVITGNVRLYVLGDVKFSGNTYMMRVNSNSTVQVYVKGNVDMTGNAVVNQNGYAINCSWYGLNSSTDWKLSGSSDFIGTAYAPYADLELKGASQYHGAFVGKTIWGSPKGMHYDEALGVGAGVNLYKVLSWQPLMAVGTNWVIETN